MQDLRVGALVVDAVEGHLEVMRGAAARLGEHAELAALLEHLGRGDLPVVDGPAPHGDVHGNEHDPQLGRLGGGDVAARLGGDDDVCHGKLPSRRSSMHILVVLVRRGHGRRKPTQARSFPQARHNSGIKM